MDGRCRRVDRYALLRLLPARDDLPDRFSAAVLSLGEVRQKCGKVLCLCEEANDVDVVIEGEVESADREACDAAYP